jgi:hypothetical protein
MKSDHFDWRSLIGGFLLGACIVFLLGLWSNTSSAALPAGPYQISASNNECFMVNTRTGVVYQWNGRWNSLGSP